MLRTFGIIAAVFTTFAIATPTLAQTICGERTRFIERLDQRYKEAPAALGMIDNGSVLELLTSSDGTWTILVTAPNGKTCLVASGENWETLPKLASGPAA